MVPLRFRSDGTFTIAQFTDVHWRDGDEADERTRALIERVLDIELPDLAVLTGDVVEGSEARDPAEACRQVVAPLEQRGVPWASVFGNHDDEGALSRAQLLDVLQGCAGCLTESGPPDVTGVGNYVLRLAVIRRHGPCRRPLLPRLELLRPPGPRPLRLDRPRPGHLVPADLADPRERVPRSRGEAARPRLLPHPAAGVRGGLGALGVPRTSERGGLRAGAQQRVLCGPRRGRRRPGHLRGPRPSERFRRRAARSAALLRPRHRPFALRARGVPAWCPHRAAAGGPARLRDLAASRRRLRRRGPDPPAWTTVMPGL